MDASREKAPSVQETFVQMAQAAGLRGRIFVTIGLLILARLGTFIPVPGIDRVAFANDIKNIYPALHILGSHKKKGMHRIGIDRNLLIYGFIFYGYSTIQPPGQ